MKFFGLLAMVFVVLAMVYFSILFWGLGRPMSSFNNEFLDKPSPWVFVPWDVTLDQSPNGNPTVIEWLDVVRDNEGLVKLVPSRLRDLGDLELSKSTDLKKTLRDYFLESKARCVVVNIISNVTDIDTQVSTEIPRDWNGRVLVQSEYEPILTQLHVQRPLFAFGTSAADRLRWLTYQSLRLLPAVNFTRDVYITPLKLSGQNAVTPAIVDEVHRRKKKIVIGPLRDQKQIDEAKSFSPDGYFILTPEAARAL